MFGFANNRKETSDDIIIMTRFIFFTISICIGIFIIYLFCHSNQESFSNINDSNLYDLLMTKSPFDVDDIFMQISDTIKQKEQHTSKIKKKLRPLRKIKTNKLTSKEIIDTLQKQLGFDYNPKYFANKEYHYEIVMQGSGKMFGFLIIIPKHTIWKPVFKGIIFDDKINMLQGAGKSINYSYYDV